MDDRPNLQSILILGKCTHAKQRHFSDKSILRRMWRTTQHSHDSELVRDRYGLAKALPTYKISQSKSMVAKSSEYACAKIWARKAAAMLIWVGKLPKPAGGIVVSHSRGAQEHD
jgi:hypothetical protein